MPCFSPFLPFSRFRLLLVAILFLSAAPGSVVQSQEAASPADEPFVSTADEPYNIEAAEVSYDEQDQIITAFGDVVISQGGRILMADAVQYDLQSDQALASGNVKLLEPTGEVLFADYIELEAQMKNGFIEGIQVLLEDGSRFAALSGERVNNSRKILKGAVFSPCEICEEGKAPLWQLKAQQVVHDEVAKDIIYRHAFLELGGVPVLYTPYFSHPDPTVKRRSGFLTPSYANSQSKGTIVKTPYYQQLTDYRDILLTPMLFSEDGFIGAVTYRENLPFGKLDITASGGDVTRRTDLEESSTFRWHIDAAGEVDIDENWRAKARLYQASDKTYLRRYEFSNENVITSEVDVEYFDGQEYGAIQAFYYQGLRPDDVDERILQVLPRLYYSNFGQFHGVPGRFNYSFEQISLLREQGSESQRLSFDGEWTVPFYGIYGQLLDVTAKLRADGYYLNENPDPLNPGANDDGLEPRLQPVLAAKWRWPFVRQSRSGRSSQVIEPIVAAVAAPNEVNSDNIPNLDSQAFEFDETNLFAINRFPGVDRISTGQRVDYGVKFGHFSGGTSTTLFVGQSYQFEESDIYDVGSGLRDNRSDVVGKLQLSKADMYEAFYRFRVDEETGDFNRNEIGINADIDPFDLSLDYIQIDNTQALSDVENRQEINVSLTTQLVDQWSFRVGTIRDLEQDASRRNAASLIYEDECLRFGLNARRDFTDDGETEPSTSFGIQIDLKHLGGTGFNQ